MVLARLARDSLHERSDVDGDYAYRNHHCRVDGDLQVVAIRNSRKCLLLLSYFLFWEYFVISRNYALLALIGFAFVALQQHRPQQNVIPWLLLGLLANTHVLGAIWSIALGSTLVIKRGRLTPRFVTGAAIYLVLLAFSVKTAAPAP